MLFSFSGVITSLNNMESNNINLSTNVCTFYIVDLELGNLFCASHKHNSLKYGLIQHPACISFTVTGKCATLKLFFVLF